MSGTASKVLGEANDATFDQEVLAARGPVLVEFFATWCGSCRRFAPTLEKVAAEYAGRVPVVQVNADEDPLLVGRYGVSSTPTLVLFSSGEPVGKPPWAGTASTTRRRADIDPHAATTGAER